jgi:nucleotide-binding universal stress UspA family protein
MAEIRAILFPTDYSEFSNKAFPYATALAAAFGAKIVLMHVAELEEEDPANPEHSFPALGSYAGEVETERVVIRGHAPYRDILRVSRAKNCDLIVMATHGRSALSQFFLGGSVAEEVTRFSDIPVFIVKVESAATAESYTGRLKEILFTTDFSEPSSRALPVAQMFADKFGATLHVLHVIDKDSADFYRERGLDRAAADFKVKADAALGAHLATLTGGGRVASFHTAEGRAEDEIVKFADANGIDLIVMSAHGHGGVREEVIGTTTDRVIRRAHCPVLAARS